MTSPFNGRMAARTGTIGSSEGWKEGEGILCRQLAFKYQRFDLIRCKEIDGVRSGAEERVRILDAEAAEREARTNGVERELRVEREWRTSLQETSISNTEKISQLHQEIDQLKRVSEVRRLSDNQYRFRAFCVSELSLPLPLLPSAIE